MLLATYTRFTHSLFQLRENHDIVWSDAGGANGYLAARCPTAPLAAHLLEQGRRTTSRGRSFAFSATSGRTGLTKSGKEYSNCFYLLKL
jgi:hypothetical protein